MAPKRDEETQRNFTDGCGWCFGRENFSEALDVHNSKKQIFIFSAIFFFFLTFNRYTASLKLILLLICSSIKKTHTLRSPFMKVDSGNVCLLSYCISLLISILMFLEKIRNIIFLKKECGGVGGWGGRGGGGR